ncbi:hypothetical protein Pmani_032931 [Petrolisthes manimaculis]|uniref:Uncharacterized protein n=1 Tax=Petrolisthes manimaculis TaxID=1843537 RepID=A0AAE1NSM1_9EUCA|nr:hypothetical protein Pmani_032931 [Petrolisthes manimaculis]
MAGTEDGRSSMSSSTAKRTEEERSSFMLAAEHTSIFSDSKGVGKRGREPALEKRCGRNNTLSRKKDEIQWRERKRKGAEQRVLVFADPLNSFTPPSPSSLLLAHTRCLTKVVYLL